MEKKYCASHSLIEWQRFPSSGKICTLHLTKSRDGVQGRLMSMQTGSTRGHHLANYHCWHTGADLICHHKHITPCPNCPAICHRATRRATQHGEDGAEGDSPRDKATWSALQTGHTTGPPAPLRFGGHSAVSQCQLTILVTVLTDRCLLCL